MMIRIVSKFPRRYEYRECQLGLRQYPSYRNYCKKPEPGPLCPPVQKNPSTGTAYTVGGLTLLTVGTIGYARYDPNFRKWLGATVPLADEFFKFIFQEEKPLSKSIYDSYEGAKKGAYEAFEKKKPVHKPEIVIPDKDYVAPRPVFPDIVEKEKKDKDETFHEVRVQDKEENVSIIGERPSTSSESIDPTDPKKLVHLESRIAESAALAIKSYNNAISAFQSYSYDISDIVERSVEDYTPALWASLKRKTETKNAFLNEAEENAKKALQDLKNLNELIESGKFDKETKTNLKHNSDRYINDLNDAKASYLDAKEVADVTERYWKKVETARNNYVEELEILFPEIDVKQKKLNLDQSNFDLFVLHAFANVLYYQKELNKLDTLGKIKLNTALEKAKKDPSFTMDDVRIQEDVEEAKRQLAEEFQKKCLDLRQQSEKDLRDSLKLQAEAHNDHLNDIVAMRELELEREFTRKLDEEIQKEQLKYKTQLAGMVGRMKGMRNAIKERVEADKIAHQSQVLWSACQALHRAVKTVTPGLPWNEQIRPLKHEVEAIQKAAADNDELVKIVVKGIPEEAVSRGVLPEDAIRERFLKVERIAKRLALIPEEGGHLPLYFLSFMQSMLLLSSPNPIPASELKDEATDFSKLNTYDILQRARYWLDRGNYAMTLRYMNLLKGASRCIANDWIKETRILLETQQAAETLMAHAVASGLIHL